MRVRFKASSSSTHFTHFAHFTVAHFPPFTNFPFFPFLSLFPSYFPSQHNAAQHGKGMNGNSIEWKDASALSHTIHEEVVIEN
jgi:hypothetical protein